MCQKSGTAALIFNFKRGMGKIDPKTTKMKQLTKEF